MYNGVQMKAADPLALLLGMVGQDQSTDPKEAASGFENLLNLVPSTPSMISFGVQPGQGAPETVMDIIKNGWSGDMIPLLVPQELIAMSGQEFPAVPANGPQASQPQVPTGTVLAGANILPPDDVNDDILYLNVRSLGNPEPIPVEFSNDTNEPQEMVLPIRLRTVELRGGRIIADAGMQTATGKEIPVRLKLDIAGSPLPPDTMSSPEHQGGDARPHTPLPRLLQELDVRMIVIERVTLDEAPVVRFGQVSTNVTVEESSAPANRTPGQVLPVQSSVSPMQTGDNPGLSSRNSDGQDESSTLFRQSTGMDADGTPAAKSDSVQVQTLSTAPVVEAGASDNRAEVSSDAARLRFYDLDYKLEQLKQSPGQRIKIQLMPPRLGKMELSVVSHRGSVTVNLTVESPQAKHAVEQNLSQLEQRLAVTGIKVDSFQLHVNQANRWNAFAQGQQQYYHGGHGSHGGRDFRQTPYHRRFSGGMHLPDAGFRQELVNCLA